MFEKEIKKLKTGDKDLRSFACLVGGIFILWGSVAGWRSHDFLVLPLAGGTILVIAGCIAPQSLKRIYLVWMRVGLCLGWVTTRVILVVLFYAVVFPIGLLGRMGGKKFLDLKFPDSADSFWRMRSREDNRMRDLERQY